MAQISVATMVVSGVTITLSENRTATADLLHLLEHDPRFSLGPRHHQRLALVCEDEDTVAAESTLTWLQAQPGCQVADVVYIDFGDPSPELPGTHRGIATA